MKLSVILLTCDRERFAARAIRCLLAQDFRDFELIVVENGSRGGVPPSLSLLAAGEPRVRLFERPRGTISTGRNFGLSQARGAFVTFFDDDDTAAPDYLSFLVSLAEETGADAAVCGSWREENGKRLPNFAEDRRLVLAPEEAVAELLLRRRCNAATPTKLFRRSLFGGIRFPEDRRVDDIFVTYKLLARARRTAFHLLPKYCFTRHGGNSSAFTTDDSLLTPEILREYGDAFRERTSWLSRRLPKIADLAQYAELSYQLSLFARLTDHGPPACEGERQRLGRELAARRAWLARCPYLQPFERERLRLVPAGEGENA